MSTTKPRITVTLEPHAHEVLSRLSAASGDPMSQIVAGFVDLAVPSLERLVVVLERARAAPQEVRAGLAAALERADRQLMPALVNGIDQADLFLADALQATAPPPAPGAPAPAAGVRWRCRGCDMVLELPKRPGACPACGRRAWGQEAASTPVPVTRGSGRSGAGRKGGARG